MFLNIYAAFAITVSGLISLIFFNAVFERRKSICTAAVINLALAMIQAAVFFVKIPALNLCVYVLYNIFFALSVYKSDIKTSVLYTFILTALMMLSEFLVVVIMHVFLAVNAQDLLVGKNMIIFSVICKTMFLFIILAARKIVLKRRTGYNYDSTYYFFIFVPVSTMILLTGLLYIINRLDETESIILLTAALPLIIAEFVCYVVYDHIIEKNRNIAILRESVHKTELQLKQYELYKQKYESSRIIMHDIKKHLSIVKAMYAQPEKAEKYISDYLGSADEAFIYTNNEVLNIILNEKAKEFKQKAIDFSFAVSTNKINKLNDNDIVALFCNLLDNAAESCEHCAEKHVLLDVYELNGTFLAINLTNSRETEPKQKNGRLVSDKADRQNHGIGMESVRRCIEKYRGDMEYFYDKDKKTFSVTVLMNFGR